jgi:hypothetical protein
VHFTVTGTHRGLVDRAVASGDIRLDLDPLDLLRALAGVANIGLGADGERAAKRLVDILIAGVNRHTKRRTETHRKTSR